MIILEWSIFPQKQHRNVWNPLGEREKKNHTVYKFIHNWRNENSSGSHSQNILFR